MKRIVSLVAIAVALLYSSNPVVGAKKPPSLDVSLSVTVEGNPNLPGSYGLVGDGREYVDGEEGVSAVFQVDNGTNDFIMDPTNSRVTAPRALWFNFADKIADGTIANPWYGGGFTSIDSYLNFKDIHSVPVGAVEERSGGFGIFPGGRVTYRLAFNPNYPAAPNFTLINTPNVTSAVEVSHPDCNTWILTPKSDAPYAENRYGSGEGAVGALISGSSSAGQFLMPFQITLIRKTPITCP